MVLFKYEIIMFQQQYAAIDVICRSYSHTCVYIMWRRQPSLIVQDKRGGSQSLQHLSVRCAEQERTHFRQTFFGGCKVA